MSEITLRIRQIRPSFWADEDIARLSEQHKLIYIGLWCVADDAGWFPWKPGEIAHALAYVGDSSAIRSAIRAIQRLPGRKRVVIAPCRRHAVLMNLIQYQRYAKSTHNVLRHKAEHEAECPTPTPRFPRKSPTSPPLGRVGIGKGSGDGGETPRTGHVREVEPGHFEVVA